MREVTILHLSDLHLSFDDEVELESFIVNVCDCILSYRKEQKKDINYIVITGDLIDKGACNSLDKFYNIFIKEICEKADCEEINVFCVPGNHDAERDNYISDLRRKYNNNHNEGCCFEINRTDFKKSLARFEEFEILNKKLIQKNSTYGVEERTFNDLKICFIRINSAIYTHDNEDYHQLGLSKIQLDELSKEYKKIFKGIKPDLSIALMHHPEEWLRLDEQTKMWDYFTSEKLPIDLILHGHIHECRVGGKIDLDSFLLSLVTGTTYEIGNKYDHKNTYLNCRLAFYSFNIDEKTIKGNLYITNNKGKFIPDRINYNSVDNNGSFTISYSKEAFFKNENVFIPIPKDNRKQIDNRYSNCLNEMIEKLWIFESASRRRIDSFFINKDLLNDDKQTIVKDFFLSIAICAKNYLFNKEESDNVRVHFRVYNNKKHVHFCATIGDREITPIKWGTEKNLIFHAYDTKRSLVKSLNPSLYYDTEGEWKDFMTVPVFIEKEKALDIPKYSFGISIKGNEMETLTTKLEILSFLRFESLLDSIISNFYRLYAWQTKE